MDKAILFTVLGSLCYLVAGYFSGSWLNRIAIILVGIANILFIWK